MEMIRLGSSGLEVSRLGFGAWQLGGHGWGDCDQSETANAVRHALDSGINFFDTADVYGLGESERQLSRALGPHRKTAVIASKFGVRWNGSNETWKDISPCYMVEALEESLRRLRIERIPLYYIHWPDGQTPVEDAVEALARQRDAGKIAAIGISNFSADQIRAAAQVTEIAAVQMQFSLISRSEFNKSRQALQELNLPLVAWGALNKGLLTGKFTTESRFGENDTRHRDPDFQGERFLENLKAADCVTSVASRLGRLPAQVAIRWLMDTPGVSVVLAGAKSAAQVSQNCEASGWQLSNEDYAQLRDLADQDSLPLAG